ncbi:hypothetical protein OS493_025701 [Desmophyllum pertusum]|uniref:Uncharacterized protein n=1 Tax=Desmophyllum pertusum TaxID=174260 RepID=A0A9W9ZPX5_9CNID|nr:hypothetical protein OS493_025701 [Desmophyllum pertusum]
MMPATDNSGGNSPKRMKKEPGGVTGKSVVILLSSDVTRRDVNVFMPNTIEMAQLKKQGKGQFKTNVEISSKMSEMDIERKLVEIFPILKEKRFYCAAAVDNRSRLEFHGEPRIWDGHSIKRKIKGNSALYIFAEEEQQQQRNIVRGLEQSTLKRSHDQVTTNEWSDSSVSDIVPVEMPFSHAVFPGSGQQAKVFSVPSNPPKNITGYPIVVSGPARTLEKRDQQDVLDKLPMQGRPNVSTIQRKSTARDVATMTASSLPQSLPMGTIMVPAGGIVVAKPGPMGDKATCISTASEQPSSGKAVFHVVKGPDARQPGLPSAPQTETELQEVVRYKSADQSRHSLDEKMSSSQVTDESLSDVQRTDDSENEMSSIASEADKKPQVPVTSDTGFDETISDEPSSHCDCDSQGGLQFLISLTEELSEDDESGIAQFWGIGDVPLEKLNAFTLSGIIPRSQQPGLVQVTVTTQASRCLGITCFKYVDETREFMKQLVEDSAQQSKFFAMLSQKLDVKPSSIIGSNCNIAENNGNILY